MKILAPLRQDTIVFVLVQILVEEVIPEQEVCYMQAKSGKQVHPNYCAAAAMDYIFATYTAFSLNLSHMSCSGPDPNLTNLS